MPLPGGSGLSSAWPGRQWNVTFSIHCTHWPIPCQEVWWRKDQPSALGVQTHTHTERSSKPGKDSGLETQEVKGKEKLQGDEAQLGVEGKGVVHPGWWLGPAILLCIHSKDYNPAMGPLPTSGACHGAGQMFPSYPATGLLWHRWTSFSGWEEHEGALGGRSVAATWLICEYLWDKGPSPGAHSPEWGWGWGPTGQPTLGFSSCAVTGTHRPGGQDSPCSLLSSLGGLKRRTGSQQDISTLWGAKGRGSKKTSFVYHWAGGRP